MNTITNTDPNHKLHQKYGKSPINILFSPSLSEYNLFYTNKSNAIVSVYLPKNFFQNDSLISMKKRFSNIKFLGLNSLIDFCKNEKLISLQIVFEWINFFIYKVYFINIKYHIRMIEDYLTPIEMKII
jgi:hypothetical protein